MTENELEYLLTENLKYAKQNQHYLIKIDRRQRFRRTMSAIYWSVIIVLIMLGIYFAYPYLMSFKAQVTTLNGQVKSVVNTVMPSTQQ